MRDLVQDRDADLRFEHGRVVPELVLERQPVDGDLVRKNARVLGPLGERDAEIEAEEVGIFRVLVLDDDLDIRHRLPEVGGQRRERPLHVLLEGHYAGCTGLGRPAEKILMASRPKTKPPMWAKNATPPPAAGATKDCEPRKSWRRNQNPRKNIAGSSKKKIGNTHVKTRPPGKSTR